MARVSVFETFISSPSCQIGVKKIKHLLSLGQLHQKAHLIGNV